MRANPFPAKDAFFGKWFNMISCWKFDHVYRIWLSNPDLLDVMEWKKVVLNCFRKLKSFSFKVDLPLHSTEIGFGRGRLDVKSNWIYVLFSKVFIFFHYHYSTYSIILAQSLSCYQRGGWGGYDKIKMSAQNTTLTLWASICFPSRVTSVKSPSSLGRLKKDSKC